MRYVFQSRNGIGAERECEGGQRDIQKSREPQLRHLYNRDKLHKGALLLNTGVFHLKFCISCNVNGRKKNSEYLLVFPLLFPKTDLHISHKPQGKVDYTFAGMWGHYGFTICLKS